MFTALNYYMNMGGVTFLLIFIVIFHCYVIWRMLTIAVVGKNIRMACSIGLTMLIFTIALSAALVIGGVILERVDREPRLRADVDSNNIVIRNIEQRVFGVVPSLWMQQETNTVKPLLDAATPVFIFSYGALSSLVGITLLIAMFVRGQLAMQMILAIFLCQYISYPLWYFFPVESPVLDMFASEFGNAVPPDISSLLPDYRPNAALMSFIQGRIALDHVFHAIGFSNVTAIPSMHAAFTVIVAAFWIRLSKVTAFVVIPYMMLSAVGAVISLQHYAIDLAAGAAVAIIVIPFTRQLGFKILSPLFILIKNDKKWLYGRFRSWHTVG